MPNLHCQKSILIFIDWYLPGTKAGGPVRSIANLTEQLSDTCTFRIVTRNTDYCESIPYYGIQANTWIEYRPNIHVYYASADHQYRKVFSRLIREINPDILYINGIYSLKFSILPLWLAKKAGKKIVVAPRGMFNPQAFSTKPLKKRLFLTAAKIMGLYKGILFHATNEDERKHILQHISSSTPVRVAPNLPRKPDQAPLPPKSKKPGELKLVSIARISPEKGTRHMLEFLSKINEGKLLLDIYGPVYDENYWKECRVILEKMPSNTVVNYKGPIPGEEVPKMLTNYHFFFMPSEGENFGHSILEAFSAGLPVIISDKTPWKNLEVQQLGWDIALTNPGKFVTALNKALKMQQKEYDQWSQSAISFARAFCNDPHLLAASKKLFLNV